MQAKTKTNKERAQPPPILLRIKIGSGVRANFLMKTLWLTKLENSV